MLVGFSVNNYKSFNATQTFSMKASKIARHKEHIIQHENYKILKSSLIFGANASGKSNMVHAIKTSRDIVLRGTDRVNLSKKHFRIEKETLHQPGVFEYRIIQSEVEYSYGLAVSYINKEIIGEWLIKIERDGKERCVFERDVDEAGISVINCHMHYETDDENTRMNIYLDDFRGDISDAFKKKTILSDIAQRVNNKSGVFSEITNVYEWFKNLMIIFPNTKYNGINDASMDSEKNLFFTQMLTFFDTGIENIQGCAEEMDLDKLFQDMPSDEAQKIKLEISNEVINKPIIFKINQRMYILRQDESGNIVYNKMLLDHGNSDDLFEYADESDGTKRLFDLLPLFYEKKKSSVIIIDEIDRSLHTNLTKRFLKLFYELTKADESQLIATTHDSNLLDLELVRQDEIWFVERQEDHSSSIYSLNRYKERFDKKIDKEYLLGRYGAIPIFDESLVGSAAYE